LPLIGQARRALSADGVAALIAGGVCGANFWRRRHAHCLITGCGWLALALVARAGVAIGRSLVGGWEQMAFHVVLVVGLVLECGWYLALGSNAPGARRVSSGSIDRE
jgi:hypothetical protein